MTDGALNQWSPSRGTEPSAPATPEHESGWIAAVRNRVATTLPLTEPLPTRQPAYVGSWVYAYGVCGDRRAVLGRAQRRRACLLGVGGVAHLQREGARFLLADEKTCMSDNAVRRWPAGCISTEFKGK
jgi:hypothetical protein